MGNVAKLFPYAAESGANLQVGAPLVMRGCAESQSLVSLAYPWAAFDPYYVDRFYLRAAVPDDPGNKLAIGFPHADLDSTGPSGRLVGRMFGDTCTVLNATITGGFTNCILELHGEPNGMMAYQWSGPDGFTASGQDVHREGYGDFTGTYYLRVRNECGWGPWAEKIVSLGNMYICFYELDGQPGLCCMNGVYVTLEPDAANNCRWTGTKTFPHWADMCYDTGEWLVVVELSATQVTVRLTNSQFALDTSGSKPLDDHECCFTAHEHVVVPFANGTATIQPIAGSCPAPTICPPPYKGHVWVDGWPTGDPDYPLGDYDFLNYWISDVAPMKCTFKGYASTTAWCPTSDDPLTYSIWNSPLHRAYMGGFYYVYMAHAYFHMMNKVCGQMSGEVSVRIWRSLNPFPDTHPCEPGWPTINVTRCSFGHPNIRYDWDDNILSGCWDTLADMYFTPPSAIGRLQCLGWPTENGWLMVGASV